MSWIPAAGILFGLAGGIAGIIFGGISVIHPKGRVPAIVAMCIAFVTIIFKLVPGINLL